MRKTGVTAFVKENGKDIADTSHACDKVQYKVPSTSRYQLLHWKTQLNWGKQVFCVECGLGPLAFVDDVLLFWSSKVQTKTRWMQLTTGSKDLDCRLTPKSMQKGTQSIWQCCLPYQMREFMSWAGGLGEDIEGKSNAALKRYAHLRYKISSEITSYICVDLPW